MQTEKHPIRGYFFIATATLCWGISATLGRAAFTGRLLGGEALRPIDPLILSQSRVAFSLLILAPVLLLQRGKAALAVTRGDFLRLMVLGTLGLAASNYFYYAAIRLTSVAIAIVLQYTAPIWVLLYMVARRLQHASLQRVAAVGLAVVGAALAIGLIGGGHFHISAWGFVVAQLSAVSFAFYTAYAPAFLVRYDHWKVLLYAMLGACLCWLVVNPPWKIWEAHYSLNQWLFMLLFASTSALVPFSFYLAGLKHLDATRGIVTSCLEPVFSIIIAAIALGELVKPLQVVGIVITLAATILVQLPDRRHREDGVVVLEPIE